MKEIMEYSRRKADFAKELEECKKSASDRIWAQVAKISTLRVELSAAKEKIGQLEGSSSRLLARADSDGSGRRRSPPCSSSFRTPR